jgi:hypothetical protein
METTINIAKEFGSVLGGRWERLGPYSGEEFYRTKLLPAYLTALKNNDKLTIDLDGTRGYPSSFLDQSFGELARIYGSDNVRTTLIFKTYVFKWIVDYINKEIWR